MNYYPHHIGDFNNSTRHLTRVERSLYRDLIELYYDTEKPIFSDIERLARRVLANSDEEIKALKYVLSEYFELCGELYYHSRCEREIEKFRGNQSAKARAGKASAEARRKKAEAKKEQLKASAGQAFNTCSTEREQNPTNQEPITNNQEPIKDSEKPKRFSPKFSDWQSWGWPSLPNKEVFDDWLKARRRVRATVSERAFKTIGKELCLAAQRGFTVEQCLEQAEASGWKGFKSEWMKVETVNNGQKPRKQTSLERAVEQGRQLEQQIEFAKLQRAGLENNQSLLGADEPDF